MFKKILIFFFDFIFSIALLTGIATYIVYYYIENINTHLDSSLGVDNMNVIVDKFVFNAAFYSLLAMFVYIGIRISFRKNKSIKNKPETAVE